MTVIKEAEKSREWLRIDEPPQYATTSKQEAAIRAYAKEEGFENLRGYHSHLRSIGWDYYDVLRAVYWGQ